LSFLVLLFNIKFTNKWSNKSINDLLAVLQQAIPNGKNLPGTFAEAKKIIGKLGLSYERIHVCEKDYQLFWKEKANDDFCSVCGASRCKNKPDKTMLINNERKKATPKKVLWYFPIKPRLKRSGLGIMILHMDQDYFLILAIHLESLGIMYGAVWQKYRHIDMSCSIALM
uniref:Uncharacterized protein n=1 Tax=Aegilops tauschii subsp. strangulata TaxID=200361 RepID=A0A453GTR8_AEGTS